MTTAACTAPHNTDPTRPRTALGGLLLCAGHHAALTEALTGPSAADDPTLDADWGVRLNGRSVVRQPDRARAADYARHAITPPFDQRRPHRPVVYSADVVCGDGHDWQPPHQYRPGGIVRDYHALTARLPGLRTGEAAAHVSGSSEARLPVADHVAQLRTDIRHVLLSWARTHAEVANATPPDREDVPYLGAYLARYVDGWSSAQPFAADYVTELADLRARARSIVDLPQPRRSQVGPCPERDPDGQRCTGTLTATPREDHDPRPSYIACDTCGETYTPPQWTRLGERMKATARLTGAMA